MPELRDAEITVIGGGVLGCAVAYFLAGAGKRDVAVLEKDELASGTTSQAAGLVGQVRASAAQVRIARFSVRTFTALARETGYDPDYRQVGSFRLALTPEREAEFRRMVAVGQGEGLEVDFVPLREVRERFPLLDLAGVRAAIWCPTDGYIQPYGLTMAYARGARDLGVRIHTGTRVLGIRLTGGAVDGVVTDRGEIRTATVVVAAGPWTGLLTAAAGAELPIVPVRHQYFVTERLAGVRPDLPVLRVPDLGFYVRAEVEGLIVGGFEANPTSLDPRTFPPNYEGFSVEPDWQTVAGLAQEAFDVVPALRDAGIAAVFRGLPTFTPDGNFCIGEVPGVRGLMVAGGCCAHGVAGSAGLGTTVAAAILGEEPLVDLGPVQASRFGAAPVDWPAARRAAERAYAGYYLGLHAGSAAPGCTPAAGAEGPAPAERDR